MSGADTLRRLAAQLQAQARAGGGRGPGGQGQVPGGLFAGTGLLIAIIAGGMGLNAALFNG
jgi:prohibitin 2